MKKILSLAFVSFIHIHTSFGQMVTNFAGFIAGSTDGTGPIAKFYSPEGVCADTSGNIYVADKDNNKIRKITPAGVVTTFAGSNTYGHADGTGAAAGFGHPTGICIGLSGNIYVADFHNNKIRKITPAGVVSTFAGTGTMGSSDGIGTSASFNLPYGICADVSGNLYVTEYNGNKIRKISPTRVVTTIAGSGIQGAADGVGTTASFKLPAGICVDALGNIYIADSGNHKIRKISLAGVVSTIAGSGVQGFADGIGTVAEFNIPFGVCADTYGSIYVADNYNHRIRKITSAGLVSTFAGYGTSGSTDGFGTTAKFNRPLGICIDILGDIYIGDTGNHQIRKITGNVATTVNDKLYSKINIYPNPNNGQFTITSDVLEENTIVIIYNALGEEVYQQKITHLTETIHTGLKNGIYLLKIVDDKTVQTQKIIVN